MKYWAENDKLKLSDTEGVYENTDPFKTMKRDRKFSKFDIPDKVNHANHWPNTDRIGDPSFKPQWDGGN